MLVPHGTLVMAVDGAHMRIFRNTGEAIAPRLRLVEEAVHSVPRTSSIGADRPGRVYESATTGRSAHETTDYHQLDEDQFATEAAMRLAALLDDTTRGIVIAPPRTMGIIRKRFGANVRDRIICEITKNFGEQPATEIAAMLEDYDA